MGKTQRSSALDEAQTDFDFSGRPAAGAILDRIRTQSRDESEKGRWFEQPFMRVALRGRAPIRMPAQPPSR